jgi:Zn-dependent peptidase ImmA (M78 family)
MNPGYCEEEVRPALDAVADELLAEAGVAAPPVDALELARRLGLVVARSGATDVRARFVRLDGVDGFENASAAILLADDPRPERRHWAVAHEIGEFAAHRVADLAGFAASDLTEGDREHLANRLASCLLLPRPWFACVAESAEWDLFELKQRFSTASHELIARRMLEMSPSVVVTLCDEGRLAWRKQNCTMRCFRMSPPELAAWRTAHATGRPAQFDRDELSPGVKDVRAWPVHEPPWRREIVRMELEEFD